MKILAAPIALLLVCAPLSLGQEQTGRTEQDTSKVTEVPQYELAPIIVVAPRADRPVLFVPMAIDVLGLEEIQRAEMTLSLSEALRSVPGILVNNRTNLSRGDRVTIRGSGSRSEFGVRGIKVLVDGIPVTLPDGQAHLENVDLGSVGRIEVIRGPASALYGNASGGVVHIHTQQPHQRTVQFEPRGTVGSFGLRKWQGKVLGGTSSIDYLVNVSRTVLDGYRDHSAAEFNKVNVVGLYRHSERFRVSTLFNFFDTPYLLNPGSLTKSEAMTNPTLVRRIEKKSAAGTKGQQGQAGVTVEHAGEGSFEGTLYGQWRKITSSRVGAILDLDRLVAGGRFVYRRTGNLGSVSVRWMGGFDIERQNEKRFEYENLGIPDESIGVAEGNEILKLLQYGPIDLETEFTVLSLGPFVHLELEASPRWIVTLGARYDRVTFDFTDKLRPASGERTMGQLSPMIGLAFRARKDLTLYGNIGTAFQTPTASELEQPAGEIGLNQDLDAESMRSFEVGLKGVSAARRLSFDVALFLSITEDMLIPYQPPAANELLFRNAGRAENKGAEGRFHWEPISGLRATVAYTYMDFELTDFLRQTDGGDSVQLAGNKVPGVPPHNLFGSLNYGHPIGLYIELDAQWMAAFFANDFNGPPRGSNKPVDDYVNDSYTLVDLRLGVSRQFAIVGFDLFVGVNNLLDERYNGSIVPNARVDRFFEPAPDRNWFAGLSLKIRGGP